MIRLLTCLMAAALFGLGLAVAQMTNPLKVQNFLDVAGDWDPSLAIVMGAALFGVGWGMTGYCPGPALATLLSGNGEVLLFVPAMLLGGFLHRTFEHRV